MFSCTRWRSSPSSSTNVALVSRTSSVFTSCLRRQHRFFFATCPPHCHCHSTNPTTNFPSPLCIQESDLAWYRYMTTLAMYSCPQKYWFYNCLAKPLLPCIEVGSAPDEVIQAPFRRNKCPSPLCSPCAVPTLGRLSEDKRCCNDHTPETTTRARTARTSQRANHTLNLTKKVSPKWIRSGPRRAGSS